MIGIPPKALLRTPDQILGPFYPANKTAQETKDLAESPDRPGRASGELLRVEGRVLTLTGREVALGLAAGAIGGLCVLAAIFWSEERRSTRALT